MAAARSGGSDSGYLPEPFAPLLPCPVAIPLPPGFAALSVGTTELASVGPALLVPVEVALLFCTSIALAVPAFA